MTSFHSKRLPRSPIRMNCTIRINYTAQVIALVVLLSSVGISIPVTAESSAAEQPGTRSGAVPNFESLSGSTSAVDPEPARHQESISSPADRQKRSLQAARLVSTVQALLKKGVSAFQHGDYQSAKEQFERVVTLDPENADGYYNLGMLAAGLGDLTTAEDDLLKGLGVARGDRQLQEAYEVLKRRQAIHLPAPFQKTAWLAANPVAPLQGIANSSGLGTPSAAPPQGHATTSGLAGETATSAPLQGYASASGLEGETATSAPLQGHAGASELEDQTAAFAALQGLAQSTSASGFGAKSSRHLFTASQHEVYYQFYAPDSCD